VLAWCLWTVNFLTHKETRSPKCPWVVSARRAEIACAINQNMIKFLPPFRFHDGGCFSPWIETGNLNYSSWICSKFENIGILDETQERSNAQGTVNEKENSCYKDITELYPCRMNSKYSGRVVERTRKSASDYMLLIDCYLWRQKGDHKVRRHRIAPIQRGFDAMCAPRSLVITTADLLDWDQWHVTATVVWATLFDTSFRIIMRY